MMSEGLLGKQRRIVRVKRLMPISVADHERNKGVIEQIAIRVLDGFVMRHIGARNDMAFGVMGELEMFETLEFITETDEHAQFAEDGNVAGPIIRLFAHHEGILIGEDLADGIVPRGGRGRHAYTGFRKEMVTST